MKTDRNTPKNLLYFLSGRVAIVAVLALTSMPARPLWAEGLEKQVKFDYLDKVLTLRHFYSGDRLRFHSDGSLQGDASVGPWTLDGQIEVEDIHVHGARLVIKGRRIHRVFDGQQKLQDQLTFIKNDHAKPPKDLEKSLQRLKVEIEIELPNETPDEQAVSAAMRAVFLAGSDSMTDVVPGYWRAYFAKQEGKPPSEPSTYGTVYSSKPGGTSPPHVTYQPDPEYSDPARKARYQGTIVMGLTVDASGAPRDIQIVRPLGLGLDEKAVAAVGAWKFQPAQKDGNPVSATVMVEVSFHLY